MITARNSRESLTPLGGLALRYLKGVYEYNTDIVSQWYPRPIFFFSQGALY